MYWKLFHRVRKSPEDRPDWRGWLRVGVLLAACWLAFLLTACTSTRRIETQTTRDTLRITRTDTLRLVQLQRDSVYLRDSIYFQGTTLVKERTHYRDRWRRDTIWRTKTDTLVRTVYKDRAVQETKTKRPWWAYLPAAVTIALAGLAASGAAWIIGRKLLK